jgi:hypothetical protein
MLLQQLIKPLKLPPLLMPLMQALMLLWPPKMLLRVLN